MSRIVQVSGNGQSLWAKSSVSSAVLTHFGPCNRRPIVYLRTLACIVRVLFHQFLLKKMGLMEIKKRDGSTEIYMPEKVVVSAVKCGAPYEIAREIASSLAERSEAKMRSSEIRKYVLTELRSKGATSAANSWEAYDKEKKRRS